MEGLKKTASEIKMGLQTALLQFLIYREGGKAEVSDFLFRLSISQSQTTFFLNLFSRGI